MEQIKCIECGTIFHSTLEECPNCGRPACECKPVPPLPLPNQDNQNQGIFNAAPPPLPNNSNVAPLNPGNTTTDTGYKYERTLESLAEPIFAILIIFAILCILGGIVTMSIALIIAAPFIILDAFLTRALIMVIHNISINIHEINLKIR